MTTPFYELEAKNISGINTSMSAYRGKVVLVVNTASKCGLTPQYEGLEEVYRKFKNRGLVILGFPCNQFGGQEPGDETSIRQGCLLNYGVSFPMFSKVKVNGAAAHPIFKYLKSELKGTAGNAIKWNFTKFLVNAEGVPIKRYAPTVVPERIAADIKAVLSTVQQTAVGE